MSLLILSACSSPPTVRESPVVIEQRPVSVPSKPASTGSKPISPPTTTTSRIGSPNSRQPIRVDDGSSGDAASSEPLDPRQPVGTQTKIQTEAVAAAKSQSRPPVLALLNEADKNEAAGELALAAQKLERALRIDPRDPLPWHQLAKIQLRQQNFTQAINMATRSNTLLARDDLLRQDNLRVIATAYDALGDGDKAQQTRDLLTQ